MANPNPNYKAFETFFSEPLTPDEIEDFAEVITAGLVNGRGVLEMCGWKAEKGDNVWLYQRRHPDMPRPVVRTKGANFWHRASVAAWASENRTKPTEASEQAEH